MKRIVCVAILMVIASIIFCKKDDAKGNQKAIANEIIRLHVIANSDSEEDQKLKLEVKEVIVTYLREKVRQTKDKNEARQIMQKELLEVERLATEYMRKRGYSYEATAELGNAYFPVKQYGNLAFPAGVYEALRVKIGKSEGRNWWCVMYPSLCLVDGVYKLPEESKQKLQGVLSKEDYNSLIQNGTEVTYSSKIWEWVSNLWR